MKHWNEEQAVTVVKMKCQLNKNDCILS